MAATLIIFQYVAYQFSFDQFHRDKDDIYRLGTYFYWTDSKGSQELKLAHSWENIINELPDDFPEIERATWFTEGMEFVGHMRSEQENIWVTSTPGITTDPLKVENYITADSNFFSFFDFDLYGPLTDGVLTNPDEVIISRTMARRLFGTEDVINEFLYVNGEYSKKIIGLYEGSDN